MIDEAYTHIAGAPFNTDFVAQDKDVVILRTFSKIYGMAGLRAGAAMARPDLLKQLGKYSGGMMPITGMAAAIASLKAKYVIPERRKKIGDVRNDLLAFLDKHNIKYVPSVSNCIMIEVGESPGNHGSIAEGEGLYRPHLADLANHGARHHRSAFRDGPVQSRVAQSDGVARACQNCGPVCAIF